MTRYIKMPTDISYHAMRYTVNMINGMYIYSTILTSVYTFCAACRMMQQRIVDLVRESFGRLSYGKAVDCVQALRAATIKVRH